MLILEINVQTLKHARFPCFSYCTLDISLLFTNYLRILKYDQFNRKYKHSFSTLTYHLTKVSVAIETNTALNDD